MPIVVKNTPSYLDLLLACAQYSSPISNLIKELKYKHVKQISKTCAQLLYYSMKIPQADFITAVPLHFQRERERGFNQAELIAQHLAISVKTPYVQFLQKNIHTQNQASITSKKGRQENIQNVFSIKQSLEKQTLSQKTLIVDDVTTTGSTLNECAKVLKSNGCFSVIGLTVAHGQ